MAHKLPKVWRSDTLLVESLRGLPTCSSGLPDCQERVGASIQRVAVHRLQAVREDEPVCEHLLNPQELLSSDGVKCHESPWVKRPITLRYGGNLHHIGLGRTLTNTPVRVLIHDRSIRVIHRNTSDLIRALELDPTKDYQPQTP